MDNLIGILVFILPGFLAYFWIQAFGKNPVVKHNAAEFASISALLWLPVSITSLWILNSLPSVGNRMLVTSLVTLEQAANHIAFLFEFLLMSIVVSFVFSVLWVKYIHHGVDWLINCIRRWCKMAALSPTASVWDEFFIRISKKNRDKTMLLQIHKLDTPDKFIIGGMLNASGPFDPDRAIVLVDVEAWTELLNDCDYPIVRSYIDVKNGLIIKELDHENPTPRGAD